MTTDPKVEAAVTRLHAVDPDRLLAWLGVASDIAASGLSPSEARRIAGAAAASPRTDPTAQSTPTPAPVAVPDVRAARFAWHDVTCPEGQECRSRHSHAQLDANAGALVDVILAAGFTLAPRPEPITAPLPSEAAGLRARMVGIIADRLDAIHVPESADRDSVEMDAEEIARDLLAAGYTLPAADQPDEGTVREACGCGYSGFGGGHRDRCPANGGTR